MSTFLVALSLWLHTVATVVMFGHYIFMRLIYLPIFERQVQRNALQELLEQTSGRLRPFFGGSLLIFLVTGTYLMLINESYLGLGNFFGNSWSTLIVIKHALVIVFLVLAIYSERAFLVKINEPSALKQFRRTLNINMILGMVIVLLTSIAQAY
jgi:uncharacterized membrane protein